MIVLVLFVLALAIEKRFWPIKNNLWFSALASSGSAIKQQIY